MKKFSIFGTLMALAYLASACASSAKGSANATSTATAQMSVAGKPLGSNPKAPVQIGPDAIIEAPLAGIWNLITRVEDWGAWNPKVTEVSPGAGLSQGAELHWRHEEEKISSVIQSVKPNEEFSFLGSASGKKVLMRFSLKALDARRVRITLRGEIAYGSSQKLVDKVSHETMEWLTALNQAARDLKFDEPSPKN